MKRPKILVTGGLGYIGSHTIVELLAAGYDVVSLDNEINSSEKILDNIEKLTGTRVINIHADISNKTDSLSGVRNHGQFDGIIHFAALKSVEESVYQPLLYFRNNVEGAITTMILMDELDIPNLIFSSSCTVYGSPDKLPVTENTPMAKAESPYGASKQACELLYEQYFMQQTGKNGITLRYFNPAGAHPSAMIGESPVNKATNLVPVITETAIGKRDQMIVYGNDYDTRDGSCIRDYIHVVDLAKAHILALQYLLDKKNERAYEAFNLGIGEGVSVLEAVKAFETATGRQVNYRIGPRRPGDVPAIYSDHNLISARMGWEPEYNILSIMATAWEWEKVRSVI